MIDFNTSGYNFRWVIGSIASVFGAKFAKASPLAWYLWYSKRIW